MRGSGPVVDLDVGDGADLGVDVVNDGEFFANVVGRENVIAGTDCGLRGRAHPQITWAKLQALSDGAALASQRLWS